MKLVFRFLLHLWDSQTLDLDFHVIKHTQWFDMNKWEGGFLSNVQGNVMKTTSPLGALQPGMKYKKEPMTRLPRAHTEGSG